MFFSDNLPEPIAIIGIGCRFPGASGPSAFWKLLSEGGDLVREVPLDRWNADDLYDPDMLAPGKIINRQGSFIEHIDQFDWRAFRIPPREAKYMDPQQRLLLEVAWEGLEDAGVPFEKIAGTRTGVFIGIMWNDYFKLQSMNYSQINGYSLTGNAFAFAPNRISYVFDLKGPSLAIDTACASSLTSVHYACQSLWMGEADMALAGGVNLMLSPDISIMLSKTGVLSPSGHCKTLDARADGFVRGEGAGIVVLKPVSKLSPSDRIYAVIRGSAINHNGHNEWIMASNAEAQEMVIRDACGRCGVNPAEIDYVELHGTGLLKGDTLEAKVLGKVLGTHEGRNYPCSIGSVKTNFGHLESAAGIASIIKVALSLYYRQIPPTLHLEEINPNIPLESHGLAIQQKLGSWPDKPGPNLAGVTAVSMSGVNAHMVLEGPTQVHDESPSSEKSGDTPAQLLLLSAHSPEALLAFGQAFKDFLTDEKSGARFSLENICYTASVRRSHHEHRLALMGCSRQTIIENLRIYLQRRISDGVFLSRKAESDQDMLVELEKDGKRIDLISELLRHRNKEGTIVISHPSDVEEHVAMIEALGTLFVYGYTVDWGPLYTDKALCVQLPSFPWQRERLWLDWLDYRRSYSNPDDTIQPFVQRTEERYAFLSRFEQTHSTHRRSLLLAFIREQVLNILGLDQSYTLKPQDRLFDIGINSIGAVHLANNLQNALGHPIHPILIFNYPTVESLTDYLASHVLMLGTKSASTYRLEDDVDTREEQVYEKIEQLSEDDAEALLVRKLESIEKAEK